jgi:hypothetical protein
VTATILLALAVAAADTQTADTMWSGPVPTSVAAPARVAWVAQDDSEPPVECALPRPSTWACHSWSPHPRGLVVIIDADGGVAAIPVALATTQSMPVEGRWGRVVRIVPGPVPLEDLHDVKTSVWRPARSASRIQTLRFEAEEDPGVTVLRLSDSAFWITGGVADPDGYVRIDGPAVASVRLAIVGFQDGPPEVPLFADVSPPMSIEGQVVDGRGLGVEDAVVALWVSLRPGEVRADKKDAGRAFLRWAEARSGPEGQFEFPRTASGSYEISAIHASAGRGSTTIASLAEPVILRLTTPGFARGRVRRHGLGVAGARVRFVPDATTFSNSTDPAEHVSAEASTDTEGRFALPLPPVRRGAVQVQAPDGSVVRLPLLTTRGSRDVDLGDIPLPDARTITLRVLDPRACEFTAAGPLGELGLVMVHSTPMSIGVFQLALPEPGLWALDAECAGRTVGVEPSLVVVPAGGPEVTIDIRLEDSPR